MRRLPAPAMLPAVLALAAHGWDIPPGDLYWGYQGRTFGIGLSPHPYFARRLFARLPVAFRIRF